MASLEELKLTFFDECSELLQEMEGCLTDMQEGASSDDTVNAVFRAVHSIKGGAGAFRLDALVELVRSATPTTLTWPVLDLRPSLLAKKSAGLLYHKTDSHWNQLGAFYGDQAIVERLRAHYPQLRQLELTDFSVETTAHRGDLLHMDVLFEGYMEPAPFLRPKQDLRARFVASGEPVLAAARSAPVSFERWGETPLGGSCVTEIDDSEDVRCFKLVDGKVTFVHRRVWPALVRIARRVASCAPTIRWRSTPVSSALSWTCRTPSMRQRPRRPMKMGRCGS